MELLVNLLLVFVGYKIFKFGAGGIKMDIKQYLNKIIYFSTAVKRSIPSLIIAIVGAIIVAYNAYIIYYNIEYYYNIIASSLEK